jgi:predicted GIY-YIG superfamily endonuclease
LAPPPIHAIHHRCILSPMYPRREFHFWVYIMASRSLQLYIGMTNNFTGRVAEHKSQPPGTFTARYNIDRLVYFEHFQYVNNAIARKRTQRLEPRKEAGPDRHNEPYVARFIRSMERPSDAHSQHRLTALLSFAASPLSFAASPLSFSAHPFVFAPPFCHSQPTLYHSVAHLLSFRSEAKESAFRTQPHPPNQHPQQQVYAQSRARRI